MAISVTNLGAASNTTQLTIAITPTVAVPSGSLIAVAICQRSTSTGTIADASSNAYTLGSVSGLGGSSNNGELLFYYSYNVTALSSGASITYTKPTSKNISMSAFYATGVMSTADPIDGSVTNSTVASSSVAAITSGSPGSSGELFVSAVGLANGSTFFALDSGNGWASPFVGSTASGGVNGCSIVGGNQVNTGTGSLAWNSSAGVTANNAVSILAFKPTPSSAAAAVINRGPIPGGLIFLP